MTRDRVQHIIFADQNMLNHHVFDLSPNFDLKREKMRQKHTKNITPNHSFKPCKNSKKIIFNSFSQNSFIFYVFFASFKTQMFETKIKGNVTDGMDRTSSAPNILSTV